MTPLPLALSCHVPTIFGEIRYFSTVLYVNPWQHVTAKYDRETGIWYDWQVVDDDLACDDGLEDGR